MGRLLTPLFRSIMFFGGCIYLTLFAVAGTQVVRLGFVTWMVDNLLPFEVGFWVILATSFLIMGVEEARKLP